MKSSVFKFQKLNQKELLHAVSTRQFGSIKNTGKINKENLLKFLQEIGIESEKVVLGQQVHGGEIAVIDDESLGLVQNVDGLITQRKKIFLGVVTADCLPVLFYDPIKNIAGVAHAGYRGLLKGIAKNMVDCFREQGCDPKSIRVAIAPAIGVCCYNVEESRIRMFKKTMKGSQGWYQNKNGSYFLNLREVANLLLVRSGIKEENIEISQVCTKCNLDKFYSYRAEGPQTYGEFISIIGML